MIKQFLWTACITPFDEHGAIDYKDLERCLRVQDDAGNGIILFGSTGEGLSLSIEEKKEITQFACNLKLKTEILLCIPSHDIRSALDFIDFGNDLPISGYLMTTPIYSKPGINGQIKWFETLLDEAKYPAMLYNIPSRSGVKLYPEVIKNLAQHDRLMAIKDSGGSIDNMLDYVKNAPNISIFCGDDFMIPSMIKHGAIGAVSVMSNAYPNASRHYISRILKDEVLNSESWAVLLDFLSSATNPIPIKIMMNEIGMISNPFLRMPLSLKDIISVPALSDIHNNMIKLEKEYAL